MILWTDPTTFAICLLIYSVTLLYINNKDVEFEQECNYIQSIIDMKTEADRFTKENTIRNLKSKIDILEELKFISNEDDIIQNKIFSNLGKNFGNFAIPSLIINSDMEVLEANTAFYKIFTKEQLVFDIANFNLTNLVFIFGYEFENILNKIDYVFETGESSIVEFVEDTKYQQNPTVFKVFMNRCRQKDQDLLLLQFIRLPVPTSNTCRNLCLGLFDASSRPVFVINESLRIVDKNRAAIDYFNRLQIKNSDSKIFQIYPAILSLGDLEELGVVGYSKVKSLGQIENTGITVNELKIKERKFFIFTVYE